MTLTYNIKVRGQDEAGNYGPWTNALGNTDRFVVTQGVNRLDVDLEVFWKGVVGRDYDVLFYDSPSGFYTGMSNQWTFMQYTNRPVMFDTGATTGVSAREPPGKLTNNTYRFYRVAKEDRWQTNKNPRVGSVETYVTKALSLHPGENWFSTFFLPDTATVAYVFNTNLLPRGDMFVNATKISWFHSTSGGSTNQNGTPHTMIWLHDDGVWESEVNDRGYTGSPGTWPVPTNEAFLIELPVTADSQSLILIGLLPTQEVGHVISGGTKTSNNIHMLSLNLPVRMKISELNFIGSGFKGDNNGSESDEIRVLDNSPTNGMSQGSMVNPKARIRLRSDGTTWQYYYPPINGPGNPANYIIEPDDAVIIIRRNANTMYWTNSIPFKPQTKNFTP